MNWGVQQFSNKKINILFNALFCLDAYFMTNMMLARGLSFFFLSA